MASAPRPSAGGGLPGAAPRHVVTVAAQGARSVAGGQGHGLVPEEQGVHRRGSHMGARQSL